MGRYGTGNFLGRPGNTDQLSLRGRRRRGRDVAAAPSGPPALPAPAKTRSREPGVGTGGGGCGRKSRRRSRGAPPARSKASRGTRRKSGGAFLAGRPHRCRSVRRSYCRRDARFLKVSGRPRFGVTGQYDRVVRWHATHAAMDGDRSHCRSARSRTRRNRAEAGSTAGPRTPSACPARPWIAFGPVPASGPGRACRASRRR